MVELEIGHGDGQTDYLVYVLCILGGLPVLSLKEHKDLGYYTELCQNAHRLSFSIGAVDGQDRIYHYD